MDVGIALPATIPGVDGATVLEWARRGEARGFSVLGAIDRLVYPNYEPLVALAAAAAVTERIRLATTILIAPYRLNTKLMAKQLASIDRLSGGRLVAGIAIGARPDDYEASGASLEDRGRRFDRQIVEMKEVWDGKEYGFAGGIGPTPARDGGPPLIFGGNADAQVRRVAEHGEGWIAGGGGPDSFRATAEKVRQAWRDAGREGEPHMMALDYFALGEDAEGHRERTIRDYYGFAGPYADHLVEVSVADEDTLRRHLDEYRSLGCDEVVFCPTNP